MKLFALALATIVSIGNVHAQPQYVCPGSPAAQHAKANVWTEVFAPTCTEVRDEMLARVNGVEGWVDPHDGGVYEVVDESDPTQLTLKRTTPTNQYVDLMTFTFEAGVGTQSSCLVAGCSQSQVASVLDFSTNYCNLFIMYCATDYLCPHATYDFESTELEIKTTTGATSNKNACRTPISTRPPVSGTPTPSLTFPPSINAAASATTSFAAVVVAGIAASL